jgi:6-phosphogluconate dehydrogenase
MPGGSKEGRKALAPFLHEKIAAVAECEPCCRTWVRTARSLREDGHNGIEYGDMQLICEAYADPEEHDQSNRGGEFHQYFGEWNKGELDSFLIEIPTNIFAKKDPETGKPLVDVILDKAGQKGTGKWTVGHAGEMGVPLSVIASAVEARILSSMKDERVVASKELHGPKAKAFSGDRAALIEAVRDALYASKIVSYAQGMVQLGKAGELYNWNLNFEDISAIWRGGCIIRARFLNRITEAYRANPQLKNLMLAPFFSEILNRTQANWRTA